MVPVAWPSASVAPDGAESATVNASSPSTSTSPTTEIATVRAVVPGGNVIVPEAAA